MPQTNNAQTEPGKILYGVPAIAAYIGMEEKPCRHRIDNKIIPAFKVGGTICAKRSTIDAWLDKLEAEANG